MQPGDLIEWWCKDPFRGGEVPYTGETFFVWTGEPATVNRSVNWREFLTRGVNLLVGIDHEHVTWLSNGRLHAERLEDLRGGFEFLTGSVDVFPRAMQI
jgi:hypothetical protein